MKKRIWTVFLIAVMVFTLTGCKMSDYRSAVSMTEGGNWSDARELFSALGEYKDSTELVSECDYNIALAAMEAEDYASAISTFEALGGYRDAQAQLTECRYRYAEALCENGKYDEALAIFEELGEYGDSAEMVKECRYQKAIAFYDEEKYDEALELLMELVDYKETDRYTVLSMLKSDPDGFIDLYAEGMRLIFALNGTSHTLTEAQYEYDMHGTREFYVLYPEYFDTNGIAVTFNHVDDQHRVTNRGGQINHISVTAYAYRDDLVDETYTGYLDTAGTMMAALDDRCDYEAFRADVDNEIQKLTEALGGDEGNKSVRFDYDGYDCAAALFSFPEIKQYVFSITIPELVGEK